MHAAWSCDGKKLAAVGIDRMVRVFQPEKSVRAIYGLLPICFEAHFNNLDGDEIRILVLRRA